MINLSLKEPFESEGHVPLKVLDFDKIETFKFQLCFPCIILIISSFCRRASLWSELYSEHPDNNKKGIISDRKLSNAYEYQIIMWYDVGWYDMMLS